MRALKYVRFLVLFFALYIGAYLYLSVSGGYYFYKTGNITQFGLPTWDIWIWEPKIGRYDPFIGRRDVVGTLFSPAIILDQKYWHKDRPYFEKAADGSLVQLAPPPDALLHPQVRHNMDIILSYAPRIKAAEKNHDHAEMEKIMDEIAARMQP